MLCIDNKHTDVYFNLAAEEYLLKNFHQNIFMLWQSSPSVIIGKHQNVLAEVNLEYIKQNHIKIARRPSGGGTVFHDLGNLNLTFIENNKNVNFDKFTERIIIMLSGLGIHAESDTRHTININNLKISGSAQYIFKNRVMFHATLLFSSDLKSLVSVLESSPEQQYNHSIEDNKIYVKSVKSPVTNILKHLKKPLDIAYFKKYIMDYFLKEMPENEIYNFTEKDIYSINNLIDNKYGTQEWNLYGRKSKIQKVY